MSTELLVITACITGFIVGAVFVLAFWDKFKGK